MNEDQRRPHPQRGRPGVVEDLDADLDRVPFSGAPDPDFEVLSARPIERAAAPTVGFRIRVSDGRGCRCSRSRSPW